MDKSKQLEFIRKRNSELARQLDDLRFKADFDSQLNMEGYKQAKALILELEEIKQEWLKTLSQLQDCKTEYDFLISDLKKIRKTMASASIKIPWYKKLFKTGR